MLRAADAEPLLAYREMFSFDKFVQKSAFNAVARAANPEAEDARPEAVGKLLCDSMQHFVFSPVIARKVSKRLVTFGFDFRSSMFPFISILSFADSGSASILVVVLKVLIVRDIESAAGTLKFWQLFPQYLINAILGCAKAEA